MNHIAEEIKDFLMHYGMPRRSGRYPWGSGDDPYQHSGDFLSRIHELKSKGLTETQIAKELNLSTTQLRAYKSVANAERRMDKAATVTRLRDKEGLGWTEIARKMGLPNESSARSLYDERAKENMDKARKTADFLKQMVNEKGMLDVGEGVERELGNISKEKLKQALVMLEAEGYPVYLGSTPQATNADRKINLRILCPPGTEHKEIYEYDKINSVVDYDKLIDKDGVVRPSFAYPESLDSSRIKIRYAEEGGSNKDGLVELRRGVEDISLGDSHYAQVRILVDGTHYIKGMAAYSDDMPDGVDIVFNTNKKLGTPMMGPKDSTVLKPISKDDPNNPFGSLIKEKGGQRYYIDENGVERLSVINKRGDEGDWDEWSKKLPSQFLGKQNKALIDKQLKLAIADQEAELDEILSYSNPNVRKKLLKSYAEECDKAAENLQAAALPGQRYQVILPLTSISDNEVYAPNYSNGEKVALVRFPHAGTFEIPVLTVNNKNKEGIDVITPNAKDAIGINKKNADKLSGADFDGDTVLVIPTGKRGVNIVSKPSLDGLKDFDPHEEYGRANALTNYKSMSEKKKQTEMGKVSNLITDMQIKGAKEEEIVKAVKHSMVVIDAVKHDLDYRRSEKDNDIENLKNKYQGHYTEDGKYSTGASTLLSRASSEIDIPKRQGSPKVNDDGSLSYKTADNLYYTNKKGKTVMRTQKATQMETTPDARTLSSGHPVEEAYASYANKCKSLANKARKEEKAIKPIKYDAKAKETYKEEVSSLTADLNLAKKNAPKERRAQILTAAKVDSVVKDNPDLPKKERGKIAQRTLTSYREQVGAKRHSIDITPKKWEAMNSGAVSSTMLDEILKYSDDKVIKSYALPRSTSTLSAAKASKAQAMKNSGYTNKEIADILGVSTSTISNLKLS